MWSRCCCVSWSGCLAESSWFTFVSRFGIVMIIMRSLAVAPATWIASNIGARGDLQFSGVWDSARNVFDRSLADRVLLHGVVMSNIAPVM